MEHHTQVISLPITFTKDDELTPEQQNAQRNFPKPTERGSLDDLKVQQAEVRRQLWSFPAPPSDIREGLQAQLRTLDRRIRELEVDKIQGQIAHYDQTLDDVTPQLPGLTHALEEARKAYDAAEKAYSDAHYAHETAMGRAQGARQKKAKLEIKLADLRTALSS